MAEKNQIPPKLASDPALRAVLEQQLPGVYASKDSKHPGVKTITEHAEDVTDRLGLAFYVFKDGERAAVFNPLVVSAAEVKAADKEDRLTELFADYEQIVGGAEEGEAPTPAAPAPTGRRGGPPPPSPADKIAAVTPQAPPGASNLIGAMQSPTI